MLVTFFSGIGVASLAYGITIFQEKKASRKK